MFNFDFQKTGVFKATRASSGLAISATSLFRVIFLIVSICFVLLFIFGNLSSGLNNDYDFLLGFGLIFFGISIICFLIISFIQNKLCYPDVPEITPVTNLAEFLSVDTGRALDSAIRFSKRKNIFPIGATAFLYFLLKENPKLNFILLRLLLDIESLERRLEESFSAQKSQDAFSQGIYSLKFEQAIRDALETSQAKKHKYIEPGDMFLALAKNEPIIGAFLLDADLRPDDVRNSVLWWEDGEEIKKQKKRFWDYENLSRKGSIGRSWSSGYTITLDEYSIDYNQLVLSEGMQTVI
ncbi:MAG: hypothetical protein WC269_05695, partial [Candidatus Gracilibacteria bacterium]